MSEKRLLILFGGQSTEHEVSCVSAANVIRSVDTEAYETILVGITKDGRWLLTESVEAIENGSWKDGTTSAVLTPDAGIHGLIVTYADGSTERVYVDICFPVLHGLYGEDGTVQGILELAQIPYVGCGTLASAVSMDKLYTKIIAASAGVTQADYVPVRDVFAENHDEIADRVESSFPYPVYVKPANAGSSCGVSRAQNRSQLLDALKTASEVDSEILIEREIKGRELECAVFSSGIAKASGVGEILSAGTFYTYDAKYNNPDSRTVIDPDLPAGKADEIREAAVKVFNAVGGKGLARVDFFLENGTDRVIFNEINTLPGFTAISMYPMLWEARGVSKRQLVSDLIASASCRASRRQQS